MIAHLSVVSLVARRRLRRHLGDRRERPHTTASSAGRPPSSPPSTARPVAEPASSDQPVRHSRTPTRRSPSSTAAHAAGIPETSGPLPEPVPVDPDATPLPGPRASARRRPPPASLTTPRVPAPAPGALLWPVPGGSISQYYHAGHLALDIAAPYGTTVIAAQSGIVTWAGWRNNGGGNVIAIDHGNGMTTVYNHLGSIWVSAGQYVAAGQGIGGVGCTGMCTGPHVHFEVIVNGVIDNPLRYL